MLKKYWVMALLAPPSPCARSLARSSLEARAPGVDPIGGDLDVEAVACPVRMKSTSCWRSAAVATRPCPMVPRRAIDVADAARGGGCDSSRNPGFRVVSTQDCAVRSAPSPAAASVPTWLRYPAGAVGAGEEVTCSPSWAVANSFFHGRSRSRRKNPKLKRRSALDLIGS